MIATGVVVTTAAALLAGNDGELGGARPERLAERIVIGGAQLDPPPHAYWPRSSPPAGAGGDRLYVALYTDPGATSVRRPVWVSYSDTALDSERANSPGREKSAVVYDADTGDRLTSFKRGRDARSQPNRTTADGHAGNASLS